MKKMFSLVTAIMMMTLLLAACGKGSTTETTKPADSAASADSTTAAPATTTETKKPETIKWAVFETDNFTAALWQSIIDSFQKDNPDIKVEKVLMTGDSRPQFLKTLLAANDMPDVMLDPAELAKIKDVLADVPEDLLAQFEEGSAPVFNGKKVLIPASKQLRSETYYNKKMFADAGITDVPKTWEEFEADVAKLKAKGYTPLITAGSKDVWATSFGYWVNVINPEVEDWNPNFNADLKAGKAKWNNPVILDGLQRWQKLVKNGNYDKGSMSYGYGQAATEFLKGRAAMMMDGSWVAPGIDNAKEKAPFEVGVFPNPTKNGVKNYSASFNYMAVANNSKHKDAAFKFIKYILVDNKDVYTSYIKADGLLSSTKTPVTYDMGPLQTQFTDYTKSLKLVDEITKLPGDNALPSGMEDFTQKSMQDIFLGADISKELDKWDVEYARLMAITKQ